MTTRLAAAIALFALAATQTGLACGDKFVLLGRGARFQRAYAALHPAAILLVHPPKSVKQAAVRDPRLKSALKMAGHRVEVVSTANLAAVLAAGHYDMVLAERADTRSVLEALPAAKKPSIVAIVEGTGAVDRTGSGAQVDAVLHTPQSLESILRTLDDVMKARLDRPRIAAF
jgi:hypothetical protein